MQADVSTQGPVTVLLRRLKDGDQSAAGNLWTMSFHRIRGLARKALFGRAKRTCDGDDVAASAFRSVYRGAMAGEFPQLKGRQDLWSLLAAVTSHKCIDRMRREGRAKRGGQAEAVDADELRVVADT